MSQDVERLREQRNEALRKHEARTRRPAGRAYTVDVPELEGDGVDVLGRVHAVSYTGTLSGDGPHLYEHRFEPDAAPLLAADGANGQLFIIGGGYTTSSRGIIDANPPGYPQGFEGEQVNPRHQNPSQYEWLRLEDFEPGHMMEPHPKRRRHIAARRMMRNAWKAASLPEIKHAIKELRRARSRFNKNDHSSGAADIWYELQRTEHAISSKKPTTEKRSANPYDWVYHYHRIMPDGWRLVSSREGFARVDGPSGEKILITGLGAGATAEVYAGEAHRPDLRITVPQLGTRVAWVGDAHKRLSPLQSARMQRATKKIATMMDAEKRSANPFNPAPPAPYIPPGYHMHPGGALMRDADMNASNPTKEGRSFALISDDFREVFWVQTLQEIRDNHAAGVDPGLNLVNAAQQVMRGGVGTAVDLGGYLLVDASDPDLAAMRQNPAPIGAPWVVPAAIGAAAGYLAHPPNEPSTGASYGACLDMGMVDNDDGPGLRAALAAVEADEQEQRDYADARRRGATISEAQAYAERHTAAKPNPRLLPLAPANRKWNAAAARKRVRRWATTGKKVDWEKYARAFMYRDPDHPAVGYGFKLPFADIIKGKLVAVPHAIEAIHGVLDGARGGVQIPRKDQKRARRLVVQYYRKMRKPFTGWKK